MTPARPVVRFGDILQPNTRPYLLGPSEDANLVGMRLYGIGPFHRELKLASQIQKKSHFVIRSGDVIYNKLFAWKGTFGVVPPELDGMYVSDKFPTYRLDSSRVLIDYIRWYFRYPPLWEQARAMSTGSAALSKLTLNPPKFLDLTIALPSLAEQKRVVDHIEFIASRIEQLEHLRRQVDSATDELCRSLIRNSTTTPLRMSELVSLRNPDVTVSADETYHFAGVYCFGKGVFVGQQKSGMEFQYPRLSRLRTGDFVYPKLMAWEGALGVVPPECDGLVVSTEFPVFSVNREKVLPEVLDVHFRTPQVWPRLSGASTGTNVRRRRLNPADFLRYEFPLPPMEVQHQLRRVKSKLDSLQSERRSSARQLAAIMPSVLDRAFRGEL